MADYQEIVDNLYHEPDVYRDMADRFTRAGRLCMAESVRLRADRCDDEARPMKYDQASGNVRAANE